MGLHAKREDYNTPFHSPHTLLSRLSPLRRRYAKEKRIPYSYWLADSWWYYRGNTSGGGVTNWTARPDIFPDGFEYLTKTLGWPVQGHNRFWDRQTVYAKQNGGRYDFLFDMRSGYALPTTQVFWDDLMRNATRWGLRVYEQDWLDDEFDHFSPLTQSATLGTQWLAQMAEGASWPDYTVLHVVPSAYPCICRVEERHAGESLWRLPSWCKQAMVTVGYNQPFCVCSRHRAVQRQLLVYCRSAWLMEAL